MMSRNKSFSTFHVIKNSADKSKLEDKCPTIEKTRLRGH